MLLDEATNGKAQRRTIVRVLNCLIRHLRDEKTVELNESANSAKLRLSFGDLGSYDWR